jgi:uncharacterized protein YbjT (DUF2867 family)
MEIEPGQKLMVGVLGGSGRTGVLLLDELARRGHRAVALSRSAPPGDAAEHRRVDVRTDEGLAASLDGLDVLVDVLNGGADVLVEGARRAYEAARAEGVGHVVALSAAGAGTVPMTYYDDKAGQEAALAAAGVPWSVLRAAQFHSYVAWMLAAAARRGVLPLLRVPVEPVDAGEAAAALADRVEAGPSGRVHAFAGPRVERMDRLARGWAADTGARWRLPLRVPAVGRRLGALTHGGLLAEDPERGTLTFADWLAGGGTPAPGRRGEAA